MTTCTPKALLLLADKLENQVHRGSYDWERVEPMMLKAAAELRRLHAELDKVKQITLRDEALLRQAMDALEIGREYAFETAEQFHVEMRGYKQRRHDAMDADVKQIDNAIAALKERLK